MSGASSALQSVDEQARRAFEAAWRMGPAPPAIEQFLPPAGAAGRSGTLEELVLIDLEFAWRSGSGSGAGATAASTGTAGEGAAAQQPSARPLVESYVTRFPELNRPAVLARLLEEEFRLRRRCGDRPSPTEYRRRFPAFAADPAFQRLFTGALPASGELPLVPEIPGYQVLEPLGKGGMGSVFKARHLMLGRLVAVKVPSAAGFDPAAGLRFLREARSAATLRHPNICPIYEIGDVDGRPFLAMSYIEGGTLQGLLRAADGATPSADEVRNRIRIAAKLARAVGHAHRRGVLHRDIKPANVLMDAETGEPVLTDFGLAKEMSDDGSYLTGSGAVLGTPAYMSPEQAAGRPDRIGPHSDIYSLGALLYELLCGRPPFMGTVGEIIAAVQTQPPPPLPAGTDTAPAAACSRALAKDPAARHPTADALAEELERWLGEAPANLSVSRVAPVVPHAARRVPWRVVSVAVVFAAAAGFAAFQMGLFGGAADLAEPIATAGAAGVQAGFEAATAAAAGQTDGTGTIVIKIESKPEPGSVFVYNDRIHKDEGVFRPAGPGAWTETCPDGAIFTFSEVGRGADYLELHDAAREMGIRLYGDHSAWRHPRFSGGEWRNLYPGAWRAMYLAGEWVSGDDAAFCRMTLRQDGAKVSGTCAWPGGEFEGTIEGPELRARSRQAADRPRGTGTLRLSEDGCELSGTWNYEPGADIGALKRGPFTWRFLRDDADGRRRAADKAAEAEMLSGQQRWAEAEAAFRTAMRLAPASERYAFRAAEMLGVRNRWPEALALYREGARRDPTATLSHVGIGWSLNQLERWSEAADAFRRATELAPKDHVIMAHYAVALLRSGRRDEAVKAAEAAVRLGDTSGYVFKQLGLPVPPPPGGS